MTEIAYTIHGAPSARTPVLLTHGFGASQAMWAPNLAALSHERQVLTWDLPGHGASAALGAGDGALSHDGCLAEMLELLDDLGAERAVIGGMSLGGYLSLLFCARHPERVAALLLVDTGPGFRDDAARATWNAWVAGLADDLEASGLDALRRGPEAQAAEHAGGAAALAASARAILTQRDGEAFASLGAIAVPTLIVVGAEDERFLGAAEAMAGRIPGARKVTLEHAGHAANMDQPAAFDRAVGEFLEEL
jgi:pimeloyl-ACP methyl ester carboxylesterase